MKDIEIHVSDSARIGVVNLGAIIGDIITHLDTMDVGRRESEDAREALTAIAQTLVSIEGIGEDQKMELLEGIDFLAQAATEPRKSAPRSALHGVLTLLAQVSQASSELHSLWEQWGQSLFRFFGIG